jgi:hypothetical protein
VWVLNVHDVKYYDLRSHGCTLTVRVLPPRTPRDTPEVVSLQVGCRRDQKLKGARNTKFRQFWAVDSVISYVQYGLYCLRC